MMRSLSWSMRFALLISGVFAFGTILAGGVAWVLQSDELTRRLQAEVVADAEAIVATAGNSDRQDLIDEVSTHAAVSRDGALLIGFIDAESGDHYGNLNIGQPFAGAQRIKPSASFGPIPAVENSQTEAYFAYGLEIPQGWIIVARDDAWVAEGREILLASFSWALALALALTIILAVFIARQNEKRIARMERILDEVDAGRTGLRIHEPGNDDLARLAGRVDATLGRLEDGIDALRQVSTDVAHDLRAPLSRLRIRLEPPVLASDTPDDLRMELGAALADLDGISATFDAILRLSRLQSGAIELTRAPVDLTALSAEIHDMMLPVAEDMGHHLLLPPQTDATFATGDRELLAQLLVNLVDNALRHCPAPATITMAVQMEGGSPVLTISDTGPGIPERDRDRVTDRFVRLDASRNTRGTGLGLSLVAAICKLHGAQLALEDNDPGLRVRITFPEIRELTNL